MKKILLLCLVIFLGSGCGPKESVITEKGKPKIETEKENTLVQQKADVEKEKTVEKLQTEIIFVDICGAVKKPGVYQLPAKSRVFQAIELAEGFQEDAAKELVNQAEVLQDGQKIRIYTREEVEELKIQSTDQESVSGEHGISAGKVNLNQADKATLMTLTGIGETRAEAILAYREQKGGFSTPDELMQVDGIKQGTYDKIKDQITVN